MPHYKNNKQGFSALRGGVFGIN